MTNRTSESVRYVYNAYGYFAKSSFIFNLDDQFVSDVTMK